MRGRTVPLLLLGLPLVFLAAFYVIPMVVVLLASMTGPGGAPSAASYLRILLDEYHWGVMGVTFRLAGLTTAICVLLGYPLAYYLVRVASGRVWRRVCVLLLVLPLFTSNIVRSFGWIVLLGRRGLVNDGLTGLGLTDTPIRFLGTEAGVLIGLVYIHLPFIVLSVGNALGRLDRSLEAAATDLGAGTSTVFRTITFPLCLPGLVAGSIMVFALSVSAYVTPALLGGGRVTTLSMLIFQQYNATFDFNYGAALSVTLLVLTMLMIAAANRLGALGQRR